MKGYYIVDANGHRLAGCFVQEAVAEPLRIEVVHIPPYPTPLPTPGIPDNVVLSEN